MSIWISKTLTRGLATFSLALLAACQPVAENVPGLSLLNASEVLTVYGGAVRIAGPRHYCPDRSSLAETETSAVVLLGRCSVESEAPPAVLAISVGQAGSAGLLAENGAALAAFLTSDAGRASLSRRGRASEIKILSALMDEGTFLVQVEDAVQGRYWRGMLPVAGYLVSVSATGPALEPEAGRALVQAAARTLQRVNRP